MIMHYMEYKGGLPKGRNSSPEKRKNANIFTKIFRRKKENIKQYSSASLASSYKELIKEKDSKKKPHILLASIHSFGHLGPLVSLGKVLCNDYGYDISLVSIDSCLALNAVGQCAVTSRSWVEHSIPNVQYFSAGNIESFTSPKVTSQRRRHVQKNYNYMNSDFLKKIEDIPFISSFFPSKENTNTSINSNSINISDNEPFVRSFTSYDTDQNDLALPSMKTENLYLKVNSKSSSGKDESESNSQDHDYFDESATDLFTLLNTSSRINEAFLDKILSTYFDSGSPDMIIADSLTFGAIDAGDKLNIPVIINNAVPIWHDLLQYQGLTVPVYIFSRKIESLSTVSGRIGNILEHFLWLLLCLYGGILRNDVRYRYGLPSMSLVNQLQLKGEGKEGNALILQNTVFGIEVPRPIEPRMQMVGPLMTNVGDQSDPIKTLKKENKKLQNWLEKIQKEKDKVMTKKEIKTHFEIIQHKNLIVVHLGNSFPESINIEEIVLTIAKNFPDYQILWAYDNISEVLGKQATISIASDNMDSTTNTSQRNKKGKEKDRKRQQKILEAKLQSKQSSLPPNIFLSAYIPGWDILQKKNQIAMFVSHCSLDEASSSLQEGIPLFCFPSTGNQESLCSLFASTGAAVCNDFPPNENQTSHLLADLKVSQTNSSEAKLFDLHRNAEKVQYLLSGAGGVHRAAHLVSLALQTGLDVGTIDPQKQLNLSWFTISMTDVRFFLLILFYVIWKLISVLLTFTKRLLLRPSDQKNNIKENTGQYTDTDGKSKDELNTSFKMKTNTDNIIESENKEVSPVNENIEVKAKNYNKNNLQENLNGNEDDDKSVSFQRNVEPQTNADIYQRSKYDDLTVTTTFDDSKTNVLYAPSPSTSMKSKDSATAKNDKEEELSSELHFQETNFQINVNALKNKNDDKNSPGYEEDKYDHDNRTDMGDQQISVSPLGMGNARDRMVTSKLYGHRYNQSQPSL